MSEYQYYEWLAIDRPLDPRELAEVRQLSSHMDVATATQASVTYSYGDFKHDPIKVLLRYFDAFLYTANWGSRRLAFRIPSALLDTDALDPYLIPDVIDYQTTGSFTVLTIDLNEEDGGGGDWIDADGLLGSIAGVRRQLLQGDYRALYLAWLAVIAQRADYIEDEDFDDENDALMTEPPVPSGLQTLDGSLSAMSDFLEVPDHLVQAAAAASTSAPAASAAELHAAIAKLPRARADAYLLRLLNESPLTLGDELRLELKLNKPPASAKGQRQSARRSARTLLDAAKAQASKAAQRQQEKAHKARIAALEQLATREPQAWDSVQTELHKQTASGYTAAVQQLVDLSNLAEQRGTSHMFEAQLATLIDQFGRSRALMNRLKKARLMA